LGILHDHEQSWGFNKNDQNWKSSTTLIRNLIDCASKGGNYLLNVGPTSEGLFPQASVERLAEIGKWMKANGESIYGTIASPFKRSPGASAQRNLRPKAQPCTCTFLIGLPIRSWLFRTQDKVDKAYVLVGNRRDLATENLAEGVIVHVPQSAPDALSSTIVLKIAGPVEVEQPVLSHRQDGSVLLPASEATTHGQQIRYESGTHGTTLGSGLIPPTGLIGSLALNGQALRNPG
jgi:alpha-L-fucosidase